MRRNVNDHRRLMIDGSAHATTVRRPQTAARGVNQIGLHVARFILIMRRPIVLLAIGALGLGACSAAAPGSYSGAVVDGGIAVAARGVAQESASMPATSMAAESQAAGSPATSSQPGAATPLPSALLPGGSLTIEPSDGSVFGLPPTVPSGTNLLLFNVADVAYQMTVLEKNPSVTDSWDVILACG